MKGPKELSQERVDQLYQKFLVENVYDIVEGILKSNPEIALSYPTRRELEGALINAEATKRITPTYFSLEGIKAILFSIWLEQQPEVMRIYDEIERAERIEAGVDSDPDPVAREAPVGSAGRKGKIH